MTVGRICSRDVDSANIEESVRTAAQRMLQRKVGSLIVLDESSRPVGIVTDRDLTIKVLAYGLDGNDVKVGEIMTENPSTIADDAPVEDALAAMRGAGCRRLPVIGSAGTLVGVITLDDVLGLIAEEARMIGDLLDRESPLNISDP
jgi:CBS domain-containing protein